MLCQHLGRLVYDIEVELRPGRRNALARLLLGLVAFALGREVVVVGDHEQVSPYAVGQSSDRIRALIDELLPDIPNRQLYDGKTSVYDLARQSFGGTIRLLEHFRCVPDIIQFSNQLCYGGEIRALRDDSSSPVKRPLVAHRVGEQRDRHHHRDRRASRDRIAERVAGPGRSLGCDLEAVAVDGHADGHRGRGRHGADLGPGIGAPPEPAQQHGRAEAADQ